MIAKADDSLGLRTAGLLLFQIPGQRGVIGNETPKDGMYPVHIGDRNQPLYLPHYTLVEHKCLNSDQTDLISNKQKAKGRLTFKKGNFGKLIVCLFVFHFEYKMHP